MQEQENFSLPFKIYQENCYSLRKLKLNQYYATQELGRGQFGIVYQAIDSEKNRKVALKLLDKTKAENRSEEEREIYRKIIKSEGSLISMCSHPNLLECYEILQSKDLKILVTEFCNQKSLSDLIKAKQSLNEDEAINALKQIAHGLAELHKNRIIHRDLKPDNIFCHNGQFKIGDFGFSKVISENLNFHTFCGSQLYMAPEIKLQKPYNHKADIWSLGIIYFQMICDSISLIQRPLVAANKFSNFKMKNRKAPSEQSIDFLRRCLNKDINERMGWEQLIQHPIFHRKNKNRFSSSYQIPVVSLSSLNVQKIVEFTEKAEKWSVFQRDTLPEMQTKATMLTNSIHISTYQNSQIVSSFIQDQNYKQLQQQNLSYLKAEYILQEYIKPLQKMKIFNLTTRNNIEMMYLLSTRCFLYTSGIRKYHDSLRPDQKTENISQFLHRSQELYEEAKGYFQKYNQLLIEKENSIKSMFFDWVSKKIQFQSHFQKDVMMCGIQNYDYTSDQQCQFTEKEYLRPKMKEIKCQSERDEDKMQAKFRSYARINKITLEDLKKNDFNNIVFQYLDKC